MFPAVSLSSTPLKSSIFHKKSSLFTCLIAWPISALFVIATMAVFRPSLFSAAAFKAPLPPFSTRWLTTSGRILGNCHNNHFASPTSIRPTHLNHERRGYSYNHNNNKRQFDQVLLSGRHRFAFSTIPCTMTIADTPLGTEEGSLLLDGLDVFTVPASGDGHPLSVYGIQSSKEPESDDHVLLLLHGRTWSSVPVYHLLGGPRNAAKGVESRSLMEALHQRNITAYAMDFRGFGGTPHDSSNAVEPNRCLEDVESVLTWLAHRHHCSTPEKISLMGWSQGALVAQLAGQRRKPLFSRLILYGSIFDPMVRYPREPLYIRNRPEPNGLIENTFDAAVEDFTIEGTIPPKAATNFAEAALLSDPIKAQWKHLYQFNNCDPGMIHVPTLVVSFDWPI